MLIHLCVQKNSERLKEVKKKILFLVTEDWYFCSHRLALACATRDAGFEVTVATHVRDHGDVIVNEGFKLISIKLRRQTRNLLKDVLSILELAKIYRKEHPDIVHHVGMKPILYGTFAARTVRVPSIVNAIAGMGYVFSSTQPHARILKLLLKAAFRLILNVRNGKVIIQNPDDFKLLTNSNMIKKESLSLIKGSGVDLNHFIVTQEISGKPTVVLASRMLWNKGIDEFVNAAKNLVVAGIRARFILIGKTDPDNPESIPIAKLKDWQDEGIIEWWGYQENMPLIFSKAHIVCLPSFYGEGVPKVLIEAASCGRAIVTTDMPGCREIVRHGENGLLVPVRDSIALAAALKSLIEDPFLRKRMGARGREIAVNEFSVEKVVAETLDIYKGLLSSCG
jgi:glycosyltransferase involved in cell wall biosynthesis